jgi:hypothetical protein
MHFTHGTRERRYNTPSGSVASPNINMEDSSTADCREGNERGAPKLEGLERMLARRPY